MGYAFWKLWNKTARYTNLPPRLPTPHAGHAWMEARRHLGSRPWCGVISPEEEFISAECPACGRSDGEFSLLHAYYWFDDYGGVYVNSRDRFTGEENSTICGDGLGMSWVRDPNSGDED